eukprot:1936440-Prymnesium_polylepis.4
MRACHRIVQLDGRACGTVRGGSDRIGHRCAAASIHRFQPTTAMTSEGLRRPRDARRSARITLLNVVSRPLCEDCSFARALSAAWRPPTRPDVAFTILLCPGPLAGP